MGREMGRGGGTPAGRERCARGAGEQVAGRAGSQTLFPLQSPWQASAGRNQGPAATKRHKNVELRESSRRKAHQRLPTCRTRWLSSDSGSWREPAQQCCERAVHEVGTHVFLQHFWSPWSRHIIRPAVAVSCSGMIDVTSPGCVPSVLCNALPTLSDHDPFRLLGSDAAAPQPVSVVRACLAESSDLTSSAGPPPP